MIGTRSPLGVALTVVTLASIVAVFLVPRDVKWAVVVLTVLLIGANYARAFAGFREERAAVTAFVARHPGETAIATGLAEYEEVSRADRQRVIGVVVDRGGLSFRDRADVEVAHVSENRVLSIDLAPLRPRSASRPLLVTLADGPPVAFWVGNQPDQQVDAVVAVRAALGCAN